MSLTERLRAESNAEKKTDVGKAIPAKNETLHNPAYPDGNTSEKENGEKADTLKSDSAAPSEKVKIGDTSDKDNSEKKKSEKSGIIKNEAKEKPVDFDTAEKNLIKKVNKYANKKAEAEAQLAEVQKLKWDKDMENIGKICSKKGIVLSDLKSFLGYVRNSDTLKMLISEISVRSKTVKSEKPSVNKTG